MSSHVMIDIETLGTRPGCIVLSIGAVEFDPFGVLGRTFHEVINRRSCEAKGLFAEESTLKWWSQQSAEAQKLLAQACESEQGLGGALMQLTKFLQPCGKRDLFVWGCGSDFDIAILSHCFHIANLPIPWMFWNSRCLRTLRAIGGRKAPPRDGVYHDALDDAKNQANEAIALFQTVYARGNAA